MREIAQFDLFDLPVDDEHEVSKEESTTTIQSQDASAVEEVIFTDREPLEKKEGQRASMLQAQLDNHQELLFLVEAVLLAKEEFTKDPQKLAANFKDLLHFFVEKHYCGYIDCYFSAFIAHQKKSENAETYLGYWLLSLLVSRAYGLGHTALPQKYLYQPQYWFLENDQSEERLAVITALLKIVFGLESREGFPSEEVFKNLWKPLLFNVSAPLVVTEHGLYLERNYVQEGIIVELFKSIDSINLSKEEMDYIKARLKIYFENSTKTLNWQKFAAANAILNRISVISGGPGTGKTTTVFKILQTLIDLHHYQEKEEQAPFTILLAAPTGKAAARLSESILGQIRQLQLSVEEAPIEIQTSVRQQLEKIPHVGQTLHRLLGIHPFTRKPRYNRFNPLNFDLLVVDEASMIDQQMLVQLIGALPLEGRVIFLGDKDQLSSVEAGAIMHELCVSENYTLPHIEKLHQLLGETLPQSQLVNPQKTAFNYLSFLKQSYRFSEDSGLGKLAKIVNNEAEIGFLEQFKEMMALIKTGEKRSENQHQNSLQYTPLPIVESKLQTFIRQAFQPYITFLKQGQGIAFAEEAFKVFSKLGVLSARRTGEYGAIELNELIRKTLFPQEYHREFFHGLPIMVTHNSVENNLFNGDIGLILKNEAGQLRAYFEDVDSARVFSIHALPKFETAFAMTIHKSQGSEFQKILLFLGEEPSVFLTKELFYTGITRAKESVHIFANDQAIQAALKGRVDRFSFIHQRLSE